MDGHIAPEDLGPLATWTEDHRSDYIRSGGTRGHIVDLRILDGHRIGTMLLLRYVGRKSGRTMITPLLYGHFRSHIVIAGTNNGSDRHPAWYHNLAGGSPVAFQIATQAFSATWREPEGREYDEVWDYMLGISPRYATYRSMTQRRIPLVLLSAGDEIAPFTEPEG